MGYHTFSCGLELLPHRCESKQTSPSPRPTSHHPSAADRWDQCPHTDRACSTEENSSIPLQSAMRTVLATKQQHAVTICHAYRAGNNSSIPLQSVMCTALGVTAAYRFNLKCIQYLGQQQHIFTICHAHSAGNNSCVSLQPAMHEIQYWDAGNTVPGQLPHTVTISHACNSTGGNSNA